jgi:hypothetical protein
MMDVVVVADIVVMVLVMIVGIRDPLKLFAKQRQLMKLIL